MKDNLKEEKLSVYEIGYLLVSSIPQEKVESEVSILKDIISKNGAEFIGDEAPELRTLAYTMTKKIGPVNHRFEKGYFGWFKFELPSKNIEAVKKAFDANINVLRMLLITTTRENTYLGKKSTVPMPEIAPDAVSEVSSEANDASAPVVSTEDIDKGIDAMVK